MKQSIDLAVSKIIENRMEELATIIQEYNSRILSLDDKAENWETINKLYNIRKGLIMAFNTVFDEPYDEYINQ